MKKSAEILSVILLSMLIYSCKKENKPPVINNIQFNPTEIITNSVVTLTATATDPEGDNLSYTWNCPKGTFISTTGQSVNWTAPTDAGTYQITVTVNDGKNTVSQTSNIVVLPAIGSLSVNSTPSGANIFIDGIDTKKLTPSNFNDLPLGIKIISVTKTGYLSNKDTIAISIQYKKTSTVSFTLIPKANISGNVYYSGTKIPVSGVTVSINNKTITTGTTGSYSITEIASGNAVLSATKPDYDPFSKSLTLSAGDNSLNIDMTSGIYTNTISGTVKTSIGTIIPGVIVYLLNEDGSSTNIHDQTDATGNYQLPAVPQGQRILSFSKTGYSDKKENIFVSNSSRIFNINLTSVIISVQDPLTIIDTLNGNKITFSTQYGTELKGFNIYRSSNLISNYIKISNSLITVISNPPSNGFILYVDPNANGKSYYYKISAVNVDGYESPLSNAVFCPNGHGLYVLNGSKTVSGIVNVPFLYIEHNASLIIDGKLFLTTADFYSNGFIDASGTSSNYTGNVSGQEFNGASYGGKGGDGFYTTNQGKIIIQAAANTYGTENGEDIDQGSSCRVNGGGLISIIANNALCGGRILSLGYPASQGHGGSGASGGGILIKAAEIVIVGEIYAKGGDTYDYTNQDIGFGGGGGGRVKIFYKNLIKSPTSIIDASGGKITDYLLDKPGQPGTIYFGLY